MYSQLALIVVAFALYLVFAGSWRDQPRNDHVFVRTTLAACLVAAAPALIATVFRGIELWHDSRGRV